MMMTLFFLDFYFILLVDKSINHLELTRGTNYGVHIHSFSLAIVLLLKFISSVDAESPVNV